MEKNKLKDAKILCGADANCRVGGELTVGLLCTTLLTLQKNHLIN